VESWLGQMKMVEWGSLRGQQQAGRKNFWEKAKPQQRGKFHAAAAPQI